MKDFEISRSVDAVGIMAKNPPALDNNQPMALAAPVAAIPAAIAQWLAVATLVYLYLGAYDSVAAWGK